MERAKEFLERIVKGIVYNPDDVRVEVTEDDIGVFLRVWVNKDDMGLVIGRAGVNYNAIRLIIKSYGFCHKLKVSVKIEEPKKHV